MVQGNAARVLASGADLQESLGAVDGLWRPNGAIDETESQLSTAVVPPAVGRAVSSEAATVEEPLVMLLNTKPPSTSCGVG